MEIRVTAQSQSHRLRERMAEAQVGHGQEIRADLQGVRVELRPPAWYSGRDKVNADVFFCAMGPVRVRGVTIEGDGGSLPDYTVVQGLQVAHEGTYDLLNVLVRSNGDLRLVVDDASRVVAAPPTRRAVVMQE